MDIVLTLGSGASGAVQTLWAQSVVLLRGRSELFD